MTEYTRAFYEANMLLYVEHPDSLNAAFNSGWLSMANYYEIVAILLVGDIQQGGTVDMIIQGATDSSGTGAATISGKSITQLTQAGGDGDDDCIIRLRGEEMGGANEYSHFRVVVTPAVAAAELALVVLGTVAAYEPVGVTNWTEVVA